MTRFTYHKHCIESQAGSPGCPAGWTGPGDISAKGPHGFDFSQLHTGLDWARRNSAKGPHGLTIFGNFTVKIRHMHYLEYLSFMFQLYTGLDWAWRNSAKRPHGLQFADRMSKLYGDIICMSWSATECNTNGWTGPQATTTISAFRQMTLRAPTLSTVSCHSLIVLNLLVL